MAEPALGQDCESCSKPWLHNHCRKIQEEIGTLLPANVTQSFPETTVSFRERVLLSCSLHLPVLVLKFSSCTGENVKPREPAQEYVKSGEISIFKQLSELLSSNKSNSV